MVTFDLVNILVIIGGVVRDAMLFGKVIDDRVKLSDEQIKILESYINKVVKP